jgi:hypothetical protein
LRKALRQSLATGVRLTLSRWLARGRFAPRFGFDFVAGGAESFVGQQFQLQIGERSGRLRRRSLVSSLVASPSPGFNIIEQTFVDGLL